MLISSSKYTIPSFLVLIFWQLAFSSAREKKERKGGGARSPSSFEKRKAKGGGGGSVLAPPGMIDASACSSSSTFRNHPTPFFLPLRKRERERRGAAARKKIAGRFFWRNKHWSQEEERRSEGKNHIYCSHPFLPGGNVVRLSISDSCFPSAPVRGFGISSGFTFLGYFFGHIVHLPPHARAKPSTVGKSRITKRPL